jgi:hypothetical protein
VGTSGYYAPFSHIDPAGERVGFDVEVARAYAADRGLEIAWVPFRWPGLAADLIGVRSDPTVDPTTLLDPVFVMTRGRVVRAPDAAADPSRPRAALGGLLGGGHGRRGAGRHAQHRFGASGIPFGLVRCPVQHYQSRVFRKNRHDLTIETGQCPVNQRYANAASDPFQNKPILDVVQRIHQYMLVGQQICGIVRVDPQMMPLGNDGRIDAGHHLRGFLRLGMSQVGGVCNQLPVQIGFIENIAVHDGQKSDAAASQQGDQRTAQPTRADDGDPGFGQLDLFLPRNAGPVADVAIGPDACLKGADMDFPPG